MTPFRELRRLQFASEDGGWSYDEARERVAILLEEFGFDVFLNDAAATAGKLSRLPYSEYLKSEEWAETRRAALERAHHRCQVCNSAENLQVHHRRYDNLPLEYLADLTVLCDGCHETFHATRKLRRAA